MDYDQAVALYLAGDNRVMCDACGGFRPHGFSTGEETCKAHRAAARRLGAPEPRFKVVSVCAGERSYPFGDATFRQEYAEATAARMNKQADHCNAINDALIAYETEAVQV